MNAAQKAEPVRNLSQNALMWVLLQELADGLLWQVDGVKVRMSKEEWKVVLTAGLTKEVRLAAGINGGIVMLGRSTSKMTTREMSELIEFIHYFAASKGFKFSAPEYYAGYEQFARG
jgi:hypothetical protein